VVGGTLSCVGQSLTSNWSSTSPQSVFVFSFLGLKFCNNVTFCRCSSFLFSKGATFWTGFFGGCQLDFKKINGYHFNLFLKKLNSHFGLF
jgi:hypothetical protein